MRYSIVWVLWVGVAAAEIGDPCEEMDCPAGEICVGAADPDGRYCTKRCPAEGCPEGFVCEDASGVRVCLRPRPEAPRATFGEACGEGVAECEGDLFCASDGDSQFCTRRCNGPGSCPEGYRCAPGDLEACAPRAGASGFGESCAMRGCLEPLECIQHPSRQERSCTQVCSDGTACGADWMCDGQYCVPPQQAALPGFGEPCTNESPEPSLNGCAGTLICYDDGINSYCTQACDAQNPCPDGYGCVAAGGGGQCRRGVDDDFAFMPRDTMDVPRPPPPAVDAGVTEDKGGGGDGCAAGDPALLPLLGVGLCGLLGVALRRRHV